MKIALRWQRWCGSLVFVRCCLCMWCMAALRAWMHGCTASYCLWHVLRGGTYNNHRLYWHRFNKYIDVGRLVSIDHESFALPLSKDMLYIVHADVYRIHVVHTSLVAIVEHSVCGTMPWLAPMSVVCYDFYQFQVNLVNFFCYRALAAFSTLFLCFSLRRFKLLSVFLAFYCSLGAFSALPLPTSW